MKNYKLLLNSDRKARVYKLALGAGLAVSLAAPIAIAISCSKDSTINIDAAPFSTVLTQLKVDAANSRTDSLSWNQALQVPAAWSNAVEGVEYLIGDYPTANAARAATTWSATLPRAFTPASGTNPTSNVKLWARAVAKPNYALSNNLFDLTNSSLITTVTTTTDPNEVARDVNVDSLVTALRDINPVAVSTATNVVWQGVPEVPADLKSAVSGFEFLVGDFATQAAAQAASGWTSTLPTRLTNLGPQQRKVWVRLVAKPKVTLSTEYVDLSATTKLDVLANKSAPTPSGSANRWVFNSHREVQTSAPSEDGTQNVLVRDRDYFTPGRLWAREDDPVYAPLEKARTLNIFRTVKPREDVVNYDEDFKVKTVEATQVTRSSKRRFELIKALVLTDASGTVHEFDKDVSENDTASNDPRDVNSQHFLDVFFDTSAEKRIVKMEFKMRDNAATTNWRRNFTGEKGSAISAKDLYLGIIYSFLSIPKARINYSGLNVTYGRDATGQNSVSGTAVNVVNAIARAIGETAPRDGLQVPNITSPDALVNTFRNGTGLDLDPFLDLSKISDAVPDDGTLVLRFKNEPNDSLTTRRYFLNWLFNGAFSAIPYTETTNLVQNATVTARLKKALDDASALTADQYKLFEESLAYKAGYFHQFFANKEDFYSAGRYYLGPVSTSSIELRVNDQYIDPRWLNQKNMSGESTIIEKYRVQYIKTASNVPYDWTQYQNGNDYKAQKDGLNTTQLSDALKSPSDFGVNYIRGFTATSTPWVGQYTSLTAMPVTKDLYPRTYFNNNFSKVLYGATPEEIDKSTGKYNNGGIIESLTSGTGFEFRKLLVASMNAFSFVTGRFADGANRVDWTSLIPPEHALFGSDRTLEDALSLINTANANGPTDNGLNDEGLVGKYVFVKDAQGNWKATLFDRKSYVEQGLRTSFENKYGPSVTATVADPLDATKQITLFALLKRAFKALLDRTVGEYDPANPDATTLLWELPYSRGGQTESGSQYGFASIRSQGVYSAYKAMLKAIDPRLKVVATLEPTNKTASGEYVDAKVLVDDWPKNDTWNALESASDKENKYPNSHIDDRTPYFYASNKGINFANIRYGNRAFAFYAPTEALFREYGFLQTGNMLFQSYFADPANAAALNTPVLAPLKNLVDIVKDLFNNYMKGATAANTQFTSSFAPEFLAALQGLRFENVWKSDLKALDVYDYIGFSGLEKIYQARNAVREKIAKGIELTDDDKKVNGEGSDPGDYERAMKFLNNFFNLTISLDIWTQLRKLNTKDLTDTLLAWQIVAPDNMNPMSASITDRTVLDTNLLKSWYHRSTQAADGDTSLDISRDRVDLDRKDNFYLGKPLFKDSKGQWKTVDEGGIVY